MINLVYEIENFIIRINDRPICEFKNPPVESHDFDDNIKKAVISDDNQSLTCNSPSYFKNQNTK